MDSHRHALYVNALVSGLKCRSFSHRSVRILTLASAGEAEMHDLTLVSHWNNVVREGPRFVMAAEYILESTTFCVL